jgi:hypothetical protein
MHEYMTEILFNQLIIGESYLFLWGPNDLVLTGVCVDNMNRHGIATFTNSHWMDNGKEINAGETASAGPFFPVPTNKVHCIHETA